MTSQVMGSDFTGGSQLPNYVNGRVLTAADLATGQTTLRTRDRRIGQAAGHGVVSGLWVTSTATTLTVASGLAIAPSGGDVTVGASVTLQLTFAASASASSGASFSCCTPAQSSGSAAVSIGYYLLTALPICELSGLAPSAAAPDNTSAGVCVAQWQVEGVQFKAIPLSVGDAVMGTTITDDNRRCLLAHWCLGTPQLAQLGADPFNFNPAYGGFDTLDPADLTPADVPLAVFYWNGQQVGLVDNWSARRTVTTPDPVTAPWSGVVSDRRRVDGQARMLQFQDQAADLVSTGTAGQIVAATTFPLLPPVGFLPVSNLFIGTALRLLRDHMDSAAAPSQSTDAQPEVEKFDVAQTNPYLRVIETALSANSQQQPGYSPEVFFGDGATFGGVLDWDVADFALRQSWEMAPIQPAQASFGTFAFATADFNEVLYRRVEDSQQARDDSEQNTTSPPLTWYLVLQNLATSNAVNNSAASPTLYIVFVKNQVWLQGAQLPIISGSTQIWSAKNQWRR